MLLTRAKVIWQKATVTSLGMSYMSCHVGTPIWGGGLKVEKNKNVVIDGLRRTSQWTSISVNTGTIRD